MKKKICSVDGCSDIHRSKGFCQLHYQRHLKGVYMNAPRKLPAKGQICSIEDCDKPVRCKALCESHYSKAINTDKCPLCEKSKSSKATLCQSCWLEESKKHIPTEKYCSRCQEIKPVDNFGMRKGAGGANKWRSRCRSCEAAEQRERSELKRLAGVKIPKSKEDPELTAIRNMKRYAEELNLPWDKVIEAYPSNNLCDICSSEPVSGYLRLSLDHDHASGGFRGFLCSNCNFALGLMKDNKDFLQKAILYLEREQIPQAKF